MTTRRKVFLGVLSVLTLTTIACIALAIWSWFTHFEWERTDAYSRNSFPMHSLAKTTSSWAVVTGITTALGWFYWVRSSRLAEGTADH